MCVDITEDLERHVTIIQCPECDSYLQPPRTWLKAQPESKELLTFCIKRLRNLNKVRLVQAEFIRTEPDSKRIKVEVTVQKEDPNGSILEQAYQVEYVVQDRMCESCTRFKENPDLWVAAVQLRQDVSHRQTFLYLEQLILKHNAAKSAIKIKQADQGIDFFFNNRNHALKFVDFMGEAAPIRHRHDKQLVSHDPKSNNYSYKYTMSVEISPICREDLICLPSKAMASLGNLGQLVICNRVSGTIALLDPFTLRESYVDKEQYWRSPFESLMSSNQLVEYTVIDIEPVEDNNTGGSRYVLADARVARVSDFGKNDTVFSVRTHLGHLLKPGDTALGYDLYGVDIVVPDVVLIKKSYEEIRKKNQGKPRSWKLKSLNMEVDDNGGRDHEEKRKTEYEQFLRDLEENRDLRFNLPLYRSDESDITDGEEVPFVHLDELLPVLH